MKEKENASYSYLSLEKVVQCTFEVEYFALKI